MPLRYRFILISSALLVVLLVTLAVIQVILQTRSIRSRIEKQGLAIATNLGAVSVDHLLTYNYVVLEKMANQAVNNPDIVHVIIHDKEGRIAGYSQRPDLQRKQLTDPISLAAVKTNKSLFTTYIPDTGKVKVMEVAVPVLLPGSGDRWGTVRVCMSLELMELQFRQTLLTIILLGTIALGAGILISNWVAQRVTNPLETLVNASMEAAKGNLNPKISIQTRDEVEILASNFSFMITEVLAQKEQLKTQLEEIKRLQQYAEKILATMSDGLLAVDMEGLVTAVNPAARKILGIPDNQKVKGSHISRLVESGTQFADYIHQSLDSRPSSGQREIHQLNKETNQVLLAGASLLDPDHKTPRQMIFNLNDITLLKQLEAGIRQAQRLADLGTLAAGMAHEIRNPLSAIKTFVALLPHKISKPGFLDKFQETVQREINRLNALIEELLELARPPKYEFEPLDIKNLLMHSIELMKAELNVKNITCKWHFDPDLPLSMADANQLGKVFINLMKNSTQAMPGGGVITIDAGVENDMLVVSFSDTGHGFSKDLAPNIFSPFFTTKARGTGLGLAITHKVISEHKGQITARSEKSKGACFTICLPGVLNDSSDA